MNRRHALSLLRLIAELYEVISVPEQAPSDPADIATGPGTGPGTGPNNGPNNGRVKAEPAAK